VSTGDSPLRAQLASQIGPVVASDLMAHFERGAVIFVDRTLSLLNVAVAVAQDQSDLVEAWMHQKQLVQPTFAQAAAWKARPDLPFVSVIVQPFVLVQSV
jgi:hypothetical protein